MLIQAVKFFGRAQFQFASVDGEDVDGDDFSQTFDEIRRLRFGAEVKALNHLTVKVNANFADDQTPSGGDRDIGYHSLDEALVSFDAGAILGGGTVDSLKISAGRHKVNMGQEVHTSSKKIKTVERSAVANKIYPTRMTGVTATATKGSLSGTLGVFSTEASKEIADWNDGTAFYASATLERGNGDQIIADFLYNDANGSEDNEISDNVGMDLYEWALALAYVAERGPYEILLQGTIGDNGDGHGDYGDYRSGTFWGIVAMVSRELIADKLEAVARYSYQGSEEDEGIRANKRYLQRDHDGHVDGARGDEHHSIYGGLNYFLCGHNAKIMAGVEWENLETMYGDVDALTWWLAFRTYF
jgi:hypothetical protein